MIIVDRRDSLFDFFIRAFIDAHTRGSYAGNAAPRYAMFVPIIPCMNIPQDYRPHNSACRSLEGTLAALTAGVKPGMRAFVCSVHVVVVAESLVVTDDFVFDPSYGMVGVSYDRKASQVDHCVPVEIRGVF